MAAKKPAAKAKKSGRASTYTKALGDSICRQVSDGASLRTICAKAGMPNKSTVLRWLDAEGAQSFRDQYARAREAQADLLAEQIIQIADDGTNDTQVDDEGNVRVDQDVIARSRLRVDARKWLASKMAPKKYGDKIAVGGADDLPPIQAVTRIELVDLVDDSTDSTAA